MPSPASPNLASPCRAAPDPASPRNPSFKIPFDCRPGLIGVVHDLIGVFLIQSAVARSLFRLAQPIELDAAQAHDRRPFFDFRWQPAGPINEQFARPETEDLFLVGFELRGSAR